MFVCASPFFENWEVKREKYRLLGDSAHFSKHFPFIVTPTRDDGVLTEEDMNQNTALSRGSVIVKNVFGRIKCRWQRLRDLQNCRTDNTVKVIAARCIFFLTLP